MGDGIQITPAARRRVRIADRLPTVAPAEIAAGADGLDLFPDPDLLTAEERAAALAATQGYINRLQAYQHDLALAADTADDSRLLRAGTTGTLVAAATTADPGAGSAMLNRAKALRHLPHVAAAFARGELSVRHVAVILAEHTRIDDFPAHEAAVAAIAAAVEPGELRRVLTQLVDNSGLDDDHQTLREKRGLSLSQLPNGNWRIDGVLDRYTGEALHDALTVRMDPADKHDPRSSTQRRADALSDLLAAACAHTGRSGISGVTVLVDADRLGYGQLIDGTPLGPQLTDWLTCDPLLTVLFGRRTADATFVPLAMARTRRFATPAQWAALVARDRGCIHCGKPPRHCQAHHIIGWAQGGETTLQNMALLCSRCHHDLHMGHYHIVVVDGKPEIAPVDRAPPAHTH